MVDRYRKKIASMVIRLAMEDPKLVIEVVRELKKSGEISEDDLTYLENIAKNWIRIADQNLRKKG